MTRKTVREQLEAMPFRPFQMRLPDGRILAIPHPEFISISPTGRTAIVWKGEEDGYSIVDLLLASDLEPIESKRKRRS